MTIEGNFPGGTARKMDVGERANGSEETLPDERRAIELRTFETSLMKTLVVLANSAKPIAGYWFAVIPGVTAPFIVLPQPASVKEHADQIARIEHLDGKGWAYTITHPERVPHFKDAIP